MLKARPGKARTKTCDLAHIFHAKIGMYAYTYDFFKVQINREVEQTSLNWNETSTVMRKSPKEKEHKHLGFPYCNSH